MTNPIDNTIEQYTKEICSLLPFHRLCIFFFYTVLSNYILNEAPLAKWKEGENIIPAAKSFWVYLSNQNLDNYFSLDHGVLLHGHFIIYITAIALCTLTYFVNKWIGYGFVDFIEKKIDSDRLFASTAEQAAGVIFKNTMHAAMYISRLNSQKSEVEINLKYLGFYTEILLFTITVSSMSLLISGPILNIDLFTIIPSIAIFIILKYKYSYKYITKLKPLTIFLNTLS